MTRESFHEELERIELDLLDAWASSPASRCSGRWRR